MSNASKIVAIAKGEVGTKETRSGGHWVNNSKYNRWFGKIPGYSQNGYGWPWCAAFVSWCAHEAGIEGLYPHTAGCETAVAWFKRAGRFSEYPAVGAQVFFGPGGGSHTGLVVRYDATYIYTVEGNTNVNGSAEGDGVYSKRRRRRDSYVYGYGYPKFTEGIKSADPKYANETPHAPATPPASTPSTPATTPPTRPVVDLSNVVAAARRDPALKQGGTTHAADVKRVEAALKAEGLLSAKYASDGSYGSTTVAAYAAWQRRCGYQGRAADGIPGNDSLKRLGKKHGFDVKA